MKREHCCHTFPVLLGGGGGSPNLKGNVFRKKIHHICTQILEGRAFFLSGFYILNRFYKAVNI